MPRLARLVVPDVPHHVIQRGNRQQMIFFSNRDRTRYMEMLTEACVLHSVRCLAWCLMDNHIHLILVPITTESLRAVMASTNTRYAQRINRAQGVSGHLFQGRYSSYPMDDAHLMVAVRYVENNPVKAGMVRAAGDWPWSSAGAHLSGVGDGITDVAAIGQHISNWQAYLVQGLEAADQDEAVEAALRSGRPLGDAAWSARLALPPAPRGRRWPERLIRDSP